MADIKISGLTTASQINNGDNIELSQDSGGGNLVSLKATILAVATKILKGINFTSDLQTTDKTIIGAINEAAQGGGGGSSSLAGLSDVDIDDQTLDDDQVLVWDSVNEKWVNADQSGQGGTTVVAEEYDSTSTYSVGDYCIHEGSLYKCTTAITVVGAWDANYWTETLVMDEVSAGGGGGASWTDVIGTLSAGSTTITLSNVAITTSSTIDVYTGTFGVSPTNIVVSTGSVTLTFAEQSSNLSVKVRVS